MIIILGFSQQKRHSTQSNPKLIKKMAFTQRNLSYSPRGRNPPHGLPGPGGGPGRNRLNQQVSGQHAVHQRNRLFKYKKNSFYLPLYLALLMKIFNHITEMLHLRLIQVNIIILGGEETKMEDINVTLNHFPSVVCQRKKSNGETCCKCV